MLFWECHSQISEHCHIFKDFSSYVCLNLYFSLLVTYKHITFFLSLYLNYLLTSAYRASVFFLIKTRILLYIRSASSHMWNKILVHWITVHLQSRTKQDGVCNINYTTAIPFWIFYDLNFETQKFCYTYAHTNAFKSHAHEYRYYRGNWSIM